MAGRQTSKALSAEEVHLAELNAVMAGDEIGGGRVEEQVRQHKVEQVVLAGEHELLAADRDGQFLRLAAVDLSRRQRLHKIAGFGDPRLTLREGRLGVRAARNVYSRESPRAAD